jgi:hypothetical protein
MWWTATTVLMLLGAVPAAGAAGTGGSTAGAVGTAAVLDAAARQEAQVLGEVLGRLRSLEGETARLAEAQRAAEARHAAALSTAAARHTAAVAVLERRVSELEKGGKQRMSRSRKQASSPACGAARSQGVMDACCPTTGGHRRLQTQCALPSTCGTLHCADAFTSFYEDCTQMVGSSLAYQHFYANCQELKAQSAQMLLQPVTVQMFKVHIATNVTAGPPPPPAASSSGASSSALQEYHAVCSSATIIDCVPTCNATHHGYVLLATIDGTDTKFSCDLAHGIFSWMGAASEGGYLGGDVSSFFSAVVSGAAGIYLVTLTEDVAISTDLMIQPGQVVKITGNLGLSVAPSWGNGGFAVQQSGLLTLTHIGLDPAAVLLVKDGGSLSLSSMIVSTATMTMAVAQLSGVGSRLQLLAVTLMEYPTAGEMTGTMLMGNNNSKTVDPPGAFGGTFTITSGPCEVSEGGRCVGQPSGYNENDSCSISVGGGGGLLGTCPVFDFDDRYDPDTSGEADYVTMPDGSKHGPGSCPAGTRLAIGEVLMFHASRYGQGTYQGSTFSDHGLGGGWIVCFA